MVTQAAQDFSLGLPFGGAPSDVGNGWLVESHAHDEDAVQGCVGLPVAAAVEAVSVGSPG